MESKLAGALPISTEGESIGFLDGGAETYPRMLLAIANAHATIRLEVYAFDFSDIGQQFVDALASAAGRGVRVTVRMDGWGSIAEGRKIEEVLRGAGCDVSIYNPIFAMLLGQFGRNHRKLLLVDDEVAILGGINITEDNIDHGSQKGWADFALEVRGPQCRTLGQIYRGKAHSRVKTSIRIFLSGIGEGRRMRAQYVRAIGNARYSVDIAHGYFVPDRATLRALTAAAKRGVSVRLLAPGRSDVPFARLATRSYYRRLFASGATIYEWNASVLHSKLALIDDELLLAGSFNLDPFSMANLEVLAEVTHAAAVARARKWVQDHIRASNEVREETAESIPSRFLFEPLGGCVARIAFRISRIISASRRKRK